MGPPPIPSKSLASANAAAFAEFRFAAHCGSTLAGCDARSYWSEVQVWCRRAKPFELGDWLAGLASCEYAGELPVRAALRGGIASSMALLCMKAREVSFGVKTLDPLLPEAVGLRGAERCVVRGGSTAVQSRALCRVAAARHRRL